MRREEADVNRHAAVAVFREVLRRQELMDDMMERCGIDVLDLIRRDKEQSFAEARAKCRSCLCERTCREWLLASCGGVGSPPDFCPNALLFRACLKEQG